MPLVLVASKSVVKIRFQATAGEEGAVMGIPRITESQVGRDFKDHVGPTFLAKSWSRQDGPEPCPAES